MSRTRTSLRLSSVGVAACVAIVAACYGPDGSPQYQVPVDPNAQLTLLVPQRSQFDGVANMLNFTCGTLDCHGQIGRNLRLYGVEGLRLGNGPFDVPGGQPTTTAEIDADFRSAVGLEPERWNEMINAYDNGQGEFHPEWLSIYRKALGLEAHAGLAPIAIYKADGVTYDERYTCLTSWMQGNVDQTACTKSVSNY
jgi:hypothetical protein